MYSDLLLLKARPNSSLELLEKAKFAVAAKVTFVTLICGWLWAGCVLCGLAAVLTLHPLLLYCLHVNRNPSAPSLIAQQTVMFRSTYMA